MRGLAERDIRVVTEFDLGIRGAAGTQPVVDGDIMLFLTPGEPVFRCLQRVLTPGHGAEPGPRRERTLVSLERVQRAAGPGVRGNHVAAEGDLALSNPHRDRRDIDQRDAESPARVDDPRVSRAHARAT